MSDEALRRQRIVETYAAGRTLGETAAEHGVTLLDVIAALRASAADAKARVADIAEERALVADARIETLLRKLMAAVTAPDGCLDEKLIGAVVKLLDRQAKLFGLDRQAAGGTAADWMATAGLAKLQEYGRAIGVATGDTFDGAKDKKSG